MERLHQGLADSCFLGEHMELECLAQGFVNSQSLGFGEEAAGFSIPSLEDKMPFLQMLESVDQSPQVFAFKEPNFQTLLRLQHLKKQPWEMAPNFFQDMETQSTYALELESCVTHEQLDLHSPVKSETKDVIINNTQFSSSCFEVVSSDQPKQDSSALYPQKNPPVTRERRKRKRTKQHKNKEVESLRVTHIAVERNRRRQMNDYLNSLRSLMPPSYIQRGDQASIIGGAIDFVKELEQFLQSQEAQKRMRRIEEQSNNLNCNNNPVSKSEMVISQPGDENCGMEVKAESSKSGAAEIEVSVIHNHVSLKIQCARKPGQLLQAIVTVENSLRLTVLHLNITSSLASVLYSFNLKMEDDCKLRSVDEIAAAVHQIFS